MTYRIPIDDLKDLTATGSRATMLRVLQSWGLVYVLDADGWPVVHPEHYNSLVGVRDSKPKKTQPRFE